MVHVTIKYLSNARMHEYGNGYSKIQEQESDRNGYMCQYRFNHGYAMSRVLFHTCECHLHANLSSESDDKVLYCIFQTTKAFNSNCGLLRVLV